MEKSEGVLIERRSTSVDGGASTPVILALTNSDLADFVQTAANFGTHAYAYAVTPNVDHIIRYSEDPYFRGLYRAAQFVLLDSRFLAHLLRLTTGLRLPVCPGSDLVGQLFSKVIQPDDRLLLIGSSPEKAEILRRRYGLKDLRQYVPPMGFIDDPVAVQATLQFVEQQGPFRFCFLAVGSPQQEIVAHMLQLSNKAKGLGLCIGAAIDFLTGGERRAPAWISATGLEWAYRLLQNPRRLASRYLIRGPRVFLLLPRLAFRIKSRRADLF